MHVHPARAAHATSRLAPVLLALSSACYHHHSSASRVPVFHESGPNDVDFDADWFGQLAPGERFFIDGFIDDSGFDPFDGFAFSAARPIHVEFRLFIQDPFADLDVCVYDPQLLATVACFQSTNDPESGAVDVFAAGLDFHLVVESFRGASAYRREIEVFALHADGAQGAAARGVVAEAPAPDAQAAAGKPEAASALRAYHARRPEDEPRELARLLLVAIDHDRARVHVEPLVLTSEGTWMGSRRSGR
jgi:hypothetical protein